MRRRRWAGQRTTDDRGRRVEMVDRALRGADVDDDADHSHRLARARPELARIGRPARVFAAGFFILLGVLVTASLAGLFASGGPGAGAAAGGTLVGAFCAGGFMVFLGLAIYNGPFAYPAKSANAVLLKHMLCPSCAARLDQIAPAQDGCTECVECGAAWRVPAPQVGGQP